MTTEQIVKDNKLIAEFMGYKFKNTKKYWGLYPLDDNSFLRSLGWVEFNNLRFHSSWDWLMPVCIKLDMKFVSTDIVLTFKDVINQIRNLVKN